MPIIDVYLSQETLNAAGQRDRLAERLSSSLKRCPHAVDNPRADAINWLYLHEQPAGSIYMAGKNEKRPHYRIEVSLLTGMMDDKLRALVAEDMTRCVLEEEGSSYNSLNASRVWVIFRDVPERYWSSAGHLHSLDELMAYLNHDD